VAFVVIYDACVLYPAPLRDLLLRIALTGVVRARWSDEILDECFLRSLPLASKQNIPTTLCSTPLDSRPEQLPRLCRSRRLR